MKVFEEAQLAAREELKLFTELAHRKAWRYRKSSDPAHSDTYTFNENTLHQFAASLVSAERERCAMVCENLPTPMVCYRSGYEAATMDCASAIRAETA